MKQTALSRRAFLLGLGAVSSAALLSACNTNAPSTPGPLPLSPRGNPLPARMLPVKGPVSPSLQPTSFP